MDAISLWQARVEKDGSPAASLAQKRHDGLHVPPFAAPSASIDEGLTSAPRVRAHALVASDARAIPEGALVWWKGSAPAPKEATIAIVEPPLGMVVDGGHVPVIGDACVEAILLERTRVPRVAEAIALTAVHEAGASVVTEVAVGVAALIARARAELTPVATTIGVAVGPELFVEIAKLRALRRLSDRVLATLGVPYGVAIAARTGTRGLSRLDHATNALRQTLGAAAAMIGGAELVGIESMELAQAPSALAMRLADNTGHVLSLESHLDRVDDPARGSGSIEALTDRIARDAWDLVREIERKGGLVRARAFVTERIEQDEAARRKAVRSRRVPLVGTSRFAVASERLDPNLSPPASMTSVRDAEPFEHLHTGPEARVSLVIVGERRPIEARIEFVRELVECGGLAPVVGESDARAAVICAADAAFTSEVPTLVDALARRGVSVFVAGKPGAAEQMLRDAGAKGFVAMGDDVVVFLQALRAAALGGAS
jgi:methylmalonyl-CoA mutase